MGLCLQVVRERKKIVFFFNHGIGDLLEKKKCVLPELALRKNPEL